MAIVLRHKDLQATFLPDKGMNLISFKKGSIEVIDPSTQVLFEERYAGLGALIGPHFHRQQAGCIPSIPNESLFPHIARVKAKGILDPFSHGIARYAPWKAEATATYVKASLSGDEVWKGMSLASLEGQNFNIHLEAHLKENGLFLNLSITSERASLIGIHYYYVLPNGQGRILAQVQNQVMINKQLSPIPQNWPLETKQELIFDLQEEADFTFYPYPNLLKGKILLETSTYHLYTHYESPTEDNCWQLYHPFNASFVCIEPLSTKNPHHPNLTKSALYIHLEILPL